MRDYEGTWQHANDQAKFPMVIRFYTDTVEDAAATKEARDSDPNAFPVYQERIFVRLQAPGDSKTVWDYDWESLNEKNPALTAAYSQAYSAFKRNAIDEIEGTPLSMWPRIPRPLVKALSHHGVLSVQDVAACPDDKLFMLGKEGGVLRQAARDFLTPPDQAVVSLQRENQDLRNRLEEMQAKIDTILAMPAAGDAEKRGPGRPRREA